jgi:hypothetical protein
MMIRAKLRAGVGSDPDPRRGKVRLHVARRRDQHKGADHASRRFAHLARKQVPAALVEAVARVRSAARA